MSTSIDPGCKIGCPGVNLRNSINHPNLLAAVAYILALNPRFPAAPCIESLFKLLVR